MNEPLRALAEPRRRRILTLVRDAELSAGEIAAQFDVSGPAISQHLKVLKEAGLVDERRVGTRRMYSLRRDGFAEVLEFVEQFWTDGLERLKHAAEAEERKQTRRKTRGDR
jgi:DNA-binding transcriptional ArsR family regulator